MEVTEAFVVLSDATTRDLYDEGYAVDDILSEDLDPLTIFCGVVPEPKEAPSPAASTAADVRAGPRGVRRIGT